MEAPILTYTIVSYLGIGIVFWVVRITKHLKHEPWQEWVSSLFMVAFGWPTLVYIPLPKYIHDQLPKKVPGKTSPALLKFIAIVCTAAILMCGFLIY